MMGLRLLVLCGVFWAHAAWAEGPQYILRTPGVSPCTIVWYEPDSFNVYASTTPGGAKTKLGSVQNSFESVPAKMWSWPCPTTPGQYYFSEAAVNSQGEGAHSSPHALLILDPNAPPVPTTFGIGASITSVPPLLNVRATPSRTGSYVAAVPHGSTGVIVAGPQTVNGETWWQIRWSAGVTGWSLETLLTLVGV